jgi:1-phosphatidylinositol-4-phosphate 5-kinase
LKDNYHGQGTYYSSDGRKYTGQFVDGLREGFGKLEFPYGASYEGQFFKDKMHGQGTYKRKIGSYYTGHFVDNLKEGFGKDEWPSGDSYEG